MQLQEKFLPAKDKEKFIIYVKSSMVKILQIRRSKTEIHTHQEISLSTAVNKILYLFQKVVF
jgi:hypothetical protein